MKRLLLSTFAAAVCLQVEAQTYSNTPVPVTGFNADVVSDGSGTAASSAPDEIDGVGYNMVAQNYVNPANQTPAAFLPTGGLINSLATSGLSFQLAPYTGNNSLRLTTPNNTGTLTFATPRTADKINLLVTSAYGCTYTATINFTDATTQTFTGNVVPNWFDGTSAAIAAKSLGRIKRLDNSLENPANNPRLYQYSLVLNAANITKNIQSITFTKTSTVANEILHVFAVTASTALPSDIGISAITAPTSPAAPGVSQPVMVKVKNYGSNPLTSATIGFKVNGTTVVNNYAFTASPAIAMNGESAPVTIGNFTFPAGTNKIKAWTKLPNNIADGAAPNDTLEVSIIACNALSGTFTIDKSAPASATSFPSFAAALQGLTSCGIAGPVVFNIASGSGPYNEQVVFPAITGTSATNTITINGNGNTLVNSATTGDALKLNGAKYFRFNNLKIETNSAATAGTVISLAGGADFNTFNGCTFKHSIAATASSQVVSLSSSSNNTFQNNSIIGGYYGIYNYGASASKNNDNQFIGNTLTDQYYYGIYSYYTTGSIYDGNDISRPNRTNSTTLYAIYLTSTNTGTVISKNRIHNTHDAATSTTGAVYGIYTSSPGISGTETIIKNNAIYNINNSGGTLYAFYNSSGNNTYYFHNTVSADNSNITYTTLRGMYFLSASTNVKFNNNNISLGSTATTKHALYLSSATIALESKNNNLYAPNGNVGYYSANKATLADWKAVNNSAYDQASVSVDPQYLALATGNLKPANVGMDNIGLPLTPAVTDDITGTVRSTTTPDPGAFEFTVSTTDVGIINVTGPTSGCGLTSTQAITVTIKNYGSSPQTNIPVNFTVNGTIVGTGTFAGPLAPNATGTLTFTTTANLSGAGSYVIAGNTLMTGDTDASNNSATLNITNSLITTFPINLDFETAATGLGAMQITTKPKSNISNGSGASFGAGSTKGMIMDAVDNSSWVMPVGVTNPWTNNPDNFASASLCITPAGGTATDSLWLTFDLKQTFKTANANTNFRVMINGAQVGNTYNPPFSGTPINWQKVKVNLYAYKNDPSIQVTLESNVKEAYASGAGTANLVDNVKVVRRLVTGLKADELAAQVHIFPNPSTGQFHIDLPQGKSFQLEVTDLSGKVILQKTANGNAQLNLENTAKGIYLLKVSSENGTATRKLIIE